MITPSIIPLIKILFRPEDSPRQQPLQNTSLTNPYFTDYLPCTSLLPASAAGRRAASFWEAALAFLRDMETVAMR